MLLAGSPGSGKTLLARAMPSILRERSIEESLDVTRTYSVADQFPAGMFLILRRPFRGPHHTISHAGLVGGGDILKPGEISLAHSGVLFLAEFPEFGKRVLEVMCQLMEDRVVTINRAKASLTFSANFQLIAAITRTTRIYVLRIEDVVALARQRVTRSLTTQECQKYLHVAICPAMP